MCAGKIAAEYENASEQMCKKCHRPLWRGAHMCTALDNMTFRLYSAVGYCRTFRDLNGSWPSFMERWRRVERDPESKMNELDWVYQHNY